MHHRNTLDVLKMHRARSGVGSAGKGNGIKQAELIASVLEAVEQLCLTGRCLGSAAPGLCCLNHRKP